MASKICPICDEQFAASGGVRTHSWQEHRACHYCGEQFDSGDDETLYSHWLAAHPDDLTRVDYNRAESAVDSPSFSDQVSNQGLSEAVAGISRRRLLLAGGAITLTGLGIGGAALNGGSQDNSANPSSSGESNAVATAPVSASRDDNRYAVMGTDNPAATVTYFGNWKCPYCAEFSLGFLAQLVTGYVVPGKIAIKYRNLTYIDGDPFLGSDTPAAARAGLAVWNEDPESYWRYHEYVFRNQPPESEQWATADTLVKFTRKAGVSDPSVIRTAIQKNRYEEALRATSEAARQAGVRGTPTLLVDGTTVSPFKKDRARRLIEDTISNSGG